jgi:hypothetical protein
VPIIEHYQLERDDGGDLLLRSVPEPWPFPPDARVVSPLVAALALTESPSSLLCELGSNLLNDLASGVVIDW